MLSKAEAEYLVRIYEMGEPAGPKRVAESMGVSRPTAYEVMRKLVDKGFLVSQKGLYALTPMGISEAEKILRAHRVLETMFYRLGVDLERACRMASRIQVEIDEDIVDGICSFLGNPKTCPHGKPIPEVSR